MHYSCMATKTISLELDAYEKLRRAKRRPSESFSAVVRRAVFPGQPYKAAELLEVLRVTMRESAQPVAENTLDRLDEAQSTPRRTKSKW